MTVKDATPSNARTKALAERMFHRIQDYHKRRPGPGHEDEEETDPEVKAALGRNGKRNEKKKWWNPPKGRGFDRFLKGLEVFWAFFLGLGVGLGRELWRVVERLTDLPKI